MNNYIKNKKWIGGILIILIWLSELDEDLDLSTWEKIARASLITLTLIIAFLSSRYYFVKIQNKQAKWYVIIGIFLLLCIISYQFNSFFISPSETIINRQLSYSTVYIFDMFLAVHILIAMFLSWAYYLFERNKENELALSNLIALNKESELNELKKQLNPHFLFNALSNIYSIAYLGDKQTPDKILQLSKMLRYVIYETDVKFIDLSKEIEYLEYFIDFQKFKIKKEQQIDFNFSQATENYKIAPLLLLPFIENAFKHSQIASEPNAWVSISLITKNNSIFFSVENTISKKAQPEILNNEGIGLENIKKRVQLIYNTNATLEIFQKETFKITLTINTL